MSDYQKWIGEIYREVERLLECPTSDAQGVVDAQEFVLAQQWGRGASPQDAAAAIVKEGTK